MILLKLLLKWYWLPFLVGNAGNQEASFLGDKVLGKPIGFQAVHTVVYGLAHER